MNILLIVNGYKQSAIAAAQNFCQLAKDAGHDVSCHTTEAPRHAIEIAREHGAQHDILIAAGGDGTVNECVSGLMQLDRKPAFAILPLGSGNDFTRSSGFRVEPEELVQAISRGKTRPCDVGEIRGTEVQHFINIADAGLGAAVVERVMTAPSWMSPNLKFNWCILRSFVSFKKPRLHIKGDDFEVEGKCLLVAIANGRFFGSGLGIAPDASIDSKTLEVIIVGDVSLFDYLIRIPAIRKCRPLKHPGISYRKSTSIGLSGNALIEKDGERGGSLPVTVKVLPHALRLVDTR